MIDGLLAAYGRDCRGYVYCQAWIEREGSLYGLICSPRGYLRGILGLRRKSRGNSK